MKRALLAVNVLIALLDPDHDHHDSAQNWWKLNHTGGWASCPITENGFVRIMSNVLYPAEIQFTPSQLVKDLLDFVNVTDHAFWPDDVSLLDNNTFERERLISHRSLTDAYLLAVAKARKSRLVTFDRRITIFAVKGATEENLCVIY